MTNLLTLPDAPSIDGLVFRRFRGDSDFAHMAAIINAACAADQIDRVVTADDIRNNYAHLNNSDPLQDMLFVELGNDVVGYGRCEWYKDDTGLYCYTHFGFLKPQARRRGIGRAMLHFLENRLRAMAQAHPTDAPRMFQTFGEETETGKEALLLRDGYKPVRYGFSMVRPDLENLPDFPLPAGLEVRPVLPEHYRPIWDAHNEAFRDHWGFSEPTENDYQGWITDKVVFQPDLWRIAWDGDKVAGQVKSFINPAENEQFNRLRGYTEFISVGRPWRKRGLARALIVQSLQLLKARGMTEAALGVDAENLSGALRVYEDCGFKVVKRSATFRKELV